MNITSKTVLLSITEKINVGSLELNIIAQVCIPDSGLVEVDFMDETEISYMGVPITNCSDWDKFKAFHLEMGVDYNKTIVHMFEEIFNKKDMEKLVSKYRIK
jgi:hypothetical protein